VSRRRLMPGRGRLAVALLAVFGSVDCKRSPAPPPPPTPAPPASEDGLRPLTSRDGCPTGAGGAPAAPGAAQTLPPGHPPLIPGKGDLEGTVKGVAAGARGVSITIDSVRQ